MLMLSFVAMFPSLLVIGGFFFRKLKSNRWCLNVMHSRHYTFIICVALQDEDCYRYGLHVTIVCKCAYASTDCIYIYYRSGGRFLSLEAVQGKKLLLSCAFYMWVRILVILSKTMKQRPAH